MRSIPVRLFVASLALVSVAGCVTTSSPPPGNAPPPNGYPPGPNPPATTSPPPVGNPPPGPTDPGTFAAPAVLTLTGQMLPSGETEVVATIDVNGPIPYPVTLTATPPRSAQLTMGQPQEQLSLGQAGRLQRVFHLRSAGPLSPDDPLKVTLMGQSGGSGFRADKAFPPRASTPQPTGPTAPRPPGGRPPFNH